MQVINEDESIYSFLLRALVTRYGLRKGTDLSGIISSSGVVRSIPRVHIKYAEYFNEFPPALIEYILKNHMPFRPLSEAVVAELDDTIFFEGEWDACEKMYSFRTQMRYCVECFKEQISNVGHPFFRLQWLRTTVCELHDQPLTHVRQLSTNCCHSPTNLIEDIRACLSGNCAKCSVDNWQFASPVYLNKDYVQNYLLLPSQERLTRELVKHVFNT